MLQKYLKGGAKNATAPDYLRSILNLTMNLKTQIEILENHIIKIVGDDINDFTY